MQLRRSAVALALAVVLGLCCLCGVVRADAGAADSEVDTVSTSSYPADVVCAMYPNSNFCDEEYAALFVCLLACIRAAVVCRQK
jgi:hypothetical protein